MRTGGRCWAVCAVWGLLWGTVLARQFVDMTGPGCFSTGDRQIQDDQVFTVFANYRPNTQPTLDHCDVTIRATQPNRRIEYLVDRLTIFDCGIEIWIFDNPEFLNNPTRRLTCSDDREGSTIQGRTSHEVIKFSLRKQSTQAKAFEYQIQVKTDHGPPFDFERDSSEFYEMPLDPGAIVGIVIAGTVLIIVAAGVAIFFCLKTRRAHKRQAKHDEASDARTAPSVVTPGTTSVLYKPASSKQREAELGGGRPGPPPSRPVSNKDQENLHTNGVLSHKVNGIHPLREVSVDGKGHRNQGPRGPGDQYDKVKDHRVYSTDGHDGFHKEQRGSTRVAQRERQQHVNPAYQRDGEERLERQASLRHKRQHLDTASDQSDLSHVRRGGHASRRDSGRAHKSSSRPWDQQSLNRGSGSVRKKGKGMNVSYSSTDWSTADSWSQSGHKHRGGSHYADCGPPLQRSRAGSGSRSRSRTRAPADPWSESANRSRAGSRGRSSSRDRQRSGLSSGRPSTRDQRSRARSASAGRSRRY